MSRLYFDPILNMPRKRRNTIDPDAATWIAAQETAGYTFAAGEADAVNVWYTSLRATNRLSMVKSAIALFLGNATYNMIPLIGPTPSQTGMTVNAKSETANGSSGRVNPGLKLSEMFSSGNRGLLQIYLKSQPVASATVLHGVSNTGSSTDTCQIGIRFTGLGTFIDFGDMRMNAAADVGDPGLISFLRTGSGTGQISRYTGSQAILSTSASGTNFTPLSTHNFMWFAKNNIGTPAAFTAHEGGLLIAADTNSTTDRDYLEVLNYNLISAFGAT